ncbi:hypothetical protein AB5J56_11205 [Streptomyces sp. R21]|uniref:HTH cro/C1-type domain-containing protein n=1 Tax=Streptomyces sp. R21 TaxID=3238627 RepID=A0AB39P3Y3_9ACTN
MIEIPDTIPPGPLRTWLEWLRELRRRAGTPALTVISDATEQRGQRVSVATIRRLLRGETVNDGTGTAVAYALAEMDLRPGANRPSADWDAFDVQLTSLLNAALVAHSQGTVHVQSNADVSMQGPVGTSVLPRARRLPISAPVSQSLGRESMIWHVVGPNGKDPYEMSPPSDTIIEIMRSLRDVNNPGRWATRFFELVLDDEESFAEAMDKEYPGFLPTESEVTLAVFEGFREAFVSEEGIYLARLQRGEMAYDRFRHPIFGGEGRVVMLLCSQRVGTPESITHRYSSQSLPRLPGYGETLVVEVVGRVSPVIDHLHRLVTRYPAPSLPELRDALYAAPGVCRTFTWGHVR